ncbi:hypothetical protein [Pseudomonas viridiflava]|uniref:hypothetical protein n=1 Tax=Pseudomonas viridiflava TaxID=33069 RepID=UPI001F11BFA5|nr:hypothetical protein [Pseudomonas viridiflava]
MPAQKRMSLKQMEVQAKALCFDWNETSPAGTTVDYESVLGSGKTVRTKTRGAAFVSSCSAVVFLEDVSGYVSIEHCTPVADQGADAASDIEVPVYKISFADSGQDFTKWYVRDGIVIDCQPVQGRTWVGAQLLQPIGDLRVGGPLDIKGRTSDVPSTLKHKIAAVEQLDASEAAIAIDFGRQWAVMIGCTPASLRLPV